MKIAISSSGEDLDSQIDPRFGRCPFFMIVEIEDKKIKDSKPIKNEAMMQGGGAGITAAQVVGNAGAEAVIAVNYGPRAFGVLSELDIEMYQGVQGTVKENVQQLIDGKLEKLEAATGPMGMGPKPGMGRGQGQGRGMGPGMGKGRGNM
ncbi:NifB/NifX family molybdenum-iron cluster-binding protein [Candidatus Woesearchaeota archaeon]|nr:NifB/NifX family molybdenum-iron cluster-binding protein [Candidatus Woesearchaeota archaeon]MBW3006310.1 NifB/NifX family molybdenum-iron cluster-binding protein [Candidatus Woesearchaeota archaeon]